MSSDGLSNEGWIGILAAASVPCIAFFAWLVGWFKSEGAQTQRLMDLELRMGSIEDRQTVTDKRADDSAEALARIEGMLSARHRNGDAQLKRIEDALGKLLSDERVAHGQKSRPEDS